MDRRNDDPPNLPDLPCDTCGREAGVCICPPCPVCGDTGNTDCYREGILELTDEQVAGRIYFDREQKQRLVAARWMASLEPGLFLEDVF